MYIKIYDTLPTEAMQIREAVFVLEQGFFEEFDTTDHHAWHLVCFEQDVPIGTCRFFKEPSGKCYVIGRIAVIKQYRGKNIGSCLLNAAEDEIEKIGGNRVVLHAQEQAKGFYQKQGYREYGEIDLDQDCPHIWMCKNLDVSERKKCDDGWCSEKFRFWVYASANEGWKNRYGRNKQNGRCFS